MFSLNTDKLAFTLQIPIFFSDLFLLVCCVLVLWFFFFCLVLGLVFCLFGGLGFFFLGGGVGVFPYKCYFPFLNDILFK